MTWRDIQGWFTWPDIYDRMAREVRDGDIIVELGVWRGRSLAYLADKLWGRRVRLVGVDAFDARGCKAYDLEMSRSLQNGDSRTLREQCRENLDKCGFDSVELIQSEAIAAADFFRNGSVRFLFIDDLHEPNHIARELRAWLPKLKRPTWIAGDDASQVMSGVLEVVPAHLDGLCWIAEIK